MYSQYPSCELEDCAEDGGLAQCSGHLTRPPPPFDADDAQGGSWIYYSCGPVTDHGSWCGAAGGADDAVKCVGLSASYPKYPYGNPTITNDEERMRVTSDAYAALKFGTCPVSILADPGWGQTTYPGTCWGNVAPPSYRNGDLIRDYRWRDYLAGGLCNGQTHRVAFTKARELACPTGYTTRNRPDGGLDCVIDAQPCQEFDRTCSPNAGGAASMLKGNPVSILTGGKLQRETDYWSPNGLLLERWYNSAGYFRPRGSSREALSGRDFWRHGYDRRFWPVFGNAHLTGIAQRPDGTLLHFDGIGREKLNRSGGAVRLQGNASTGWTLTLANGDREGYDTLARFTSITTRSGLTTAITYAGNSNFITDVTGPFGHRLTFTYVDGFLSRADLPDGGRVAYLNSTRGRVESVTYPDSSVRTYHYEKTGFPWLLTGITGERRERLATYEYDSAGRVVVSRRAGGAERYEFAYGTYGTTVAYPTGHSAGFPFINRGGVKRLYSLPGSCPDCDGTTSLEYDTLGNLLGRRNALGKTTFVYDLVRNLEISRTEALSIYGTPTPRARTTSTAWHPVYRQPAVVSIYSGAIATGTPLRTTAFTHDTDGNPLTRTVADPATGASRTWAWTYDAYGRVLTEDGPRTDVEDVTTYTYYTCTTGRQCGQVHTATNALNHTTTYLTYDAHGQPLTISDPNGVVTTLTYDTRQRLTSRDIGGAVTRFEYWPTGKLKKVTLPDRSFVTYTYDAAERLIEITDAEGSRIVYTLDAMGNRIKEDIYDQGGVPTRRRSRVVDALNRVTKEIAAANSPAVTTTVGYDNNGNQTSIAAPLSRTSGNAYDELDRLTQVTDPLTGLTRFGYDANDNLTEVTDPRNLVTRYRYDGLGNLRQVASPDTGVTGYTHDAAGNLKTRTDARGKVATHTYDALNRVTSIGYPDGAVTLGYDAGVSGKGRLTSAADASHSLVFSYDAWGNVTGKTQVVAGRSRTVGYAYTNGQLTTLTTPSGQAIGYAYDGAGRITAITVNGSSVLTGVLYDPFGPVRSWRWGNGTFTNRSYDFDGRLTNYNSAGFVGYSFDDASRITGRTDTATGGQSWTYGYDANDRLTSAARSGLSRGWTFDANGNRLTQSGTNAATYTNSTSSNRIASITGVPTRTYGYDAAGNATGYGAIALVYQDDGRLKQATNGTTTRVYVYDALGQRVGKRNGTSYAIYVYDEDGRLLGEYGNGGGLVAEYVWLGDIPVATLRSRTGGGVNVFYIHADHLNTPRKVTQPADNALRWRWDPDPFGTNPPNANPGGLGGFTLNLRFPGQYFDAETGLYYNYFRDYDPQIGRYVQSDPIGLSGSINTYAYAEGNPVSYTDPTGEFVPQLIGFGIGAGLEYLTNPCASATDILLAGGLGALGGGLSKAAFLRLGPRSLTRETGLEWSHSIARSTVNRHTSGGLNRALNQRGGLNGSWRTPASHARHDASRHVPGVDPMPLRLRALDRIPDWLKGTGLGGGVGATVAGGDCECRR